MVQPSVSELDEAAADDISGEPVCDSSNGIGGVQRDCGWIVRECGENRNWSGL